MFLDLKSLNLYLHLHLPLGCFFCTCERWFKLFIHLLHVSVVLVHGKGSGVGQCLVQFGVEFVKLCFFQFVFPVPYCFLFLIICVGFFVVFFSR